nr:palindromic element RPE4 domain-containing protein [Rickettsia endosymbiont of Ixodes pacificus]
MLFIKCHAVDLELSLRAGIVACINSTAVILRLDRGIQFKILNIFYCFLDTVVKPRYDTECVFRFTQQCLAAVGCVAISSNILRLLRNFLAMTTWCSRK